MAKLENVKILDMVNGEPTRVEYNGAVYEKTDEKAKTGDLVRVIDASDIGYVEQGGFYEIYTDGWGDLVFVDDDGDEREYDLNDWSLETFRKVSETKASADLAERLAELERRLEALEERMKPTTKEMAAKAESATKFEVGDYVVPLPESDEEYAITNTDMKLGKVIHVYGDGDIKIEIIAHEDDTEIGEEYSVEPKYFRKATAEEIEKADEAARWARIGRKPGEFKKGDIVRVLKDNPHGSEKRKGDIDEITYYDNNESFCVGEGAGWMGYEDVELIVPVEQRFDLAVEPKVGARQ
jgi:hypothetical protein